MFFVRYSQAKLKSSLRSVHFRLQRHAATVSNQGDDAVEGPSARLSKETSTFRVSQSAWIPCHTEEEWHVIWAMTNWG